MLNAEPTGQDRGLCIRSDLGERRAGVSLWKGAPGQSSLIEDRLLGSEGSGQTRTQAGWVQLGLEVDPPPQDLKWAQGVNNESCWVPWAVIRS